MTKNHCEYCVSACSYQAVEVICHIFVLTFEDFLSHHFFAAACWIVAAAMLAAEIAPRAVRFDSRNTLKITLRNDPLLPAIAVSSCWEMLCSFCTQCALGTKSRCRAMADRCGAVFANPCRSVRLRLAPPLFPVNYSTKPLTLGIRFK